MKLKKYQQLYDVMIEKLANKRSKSQIEDVQEIDKIVE
jgi:flagellin-specific chaperone FliS